MALPQCAITLPSRSSNPACRHTLAHTRPYATRLIRFKSELRTLFWDHSRYSALCYQPYKQFSLDLWSNVLVKIYTRMPSFQYMSSIYIMHWEGFRWHHLWPHFINGTRQETMYTLILNASAQQKVILPFINNTSALRTDRPWPKTHFINTFNSFPFLLVLTKAKRKSENLQWWKFLNIPKFLPFKCHKLHKR